MRSLSPWMHRQVLIFRKNICDGLDGKTSSYMGESENFLYPGNPYLLERPLTRQFLAKSQNSSVFPMLKFGIIENEEP